MKKNLFFISALALCAAVSCTKESSSLLKVPEEIVLAVSDDFNAEVSLEDTKATAVTSLPGTLYWGGTKGTRGAAGEAQKWTATSGTVSASKISTGKYQTATPTAYNYYVSNASFTVPATGNVTMTVANNNTDIIVGWTAGSTSSTPSVALGHIFARTGSFTCNTQTGYTISNVSWKIKSKAAVSGTAGTYNLSTGAWTASTATLSDQAVTNSSDLYLIPGVYTVTCSYTLSKGDYTDNFTKTADVTLVAGKVNNITATAIGGAAAEIIISVSLSSWGTQAVTATLG